MIMVTGDKHSSLVLKIVNCKKVLLLLPTKWINDQQPIYIFLYIADKLIAAYLNR